MRALSWTRAAAIVGCLFVIPPPVATGQSVTSPIAEALRVEFVLTDDRAAAERFYEARNHAPLWLAGDGSATPAARALLSWAATADQQALPVDRYNVDRLRTRLENVTTAEAAATLELDLTRLFLTYARDISSGALEPGEVTWQIDIEPPRPNPADLLRKAAAAEDMRAFLADLAPSDPAYERLRGLYGTIREIARSGGWGPPIPNGPILRLGDRDPRVKQIRDRLIALGDLPEVEQVASNTVMTDAAPAHNDPSVVDPALEAAIQRFQARHGLNTDGAVGPMTLAALNVTAEKRAEQVAVNLERMRWMNRNLGQRYVMINTAGFTMSYYENDEPRFTTRTVVGKANRHETPEFTDTLEHIVVNPSWNVPNSIATEEILPELKNDPSYLARKNMELVGADMPATAIDWTTVTPSTFPGRVRQRPGPGNALGSVKFLFPNKYAIYMHDTPSRHLFRRDERDYSHGCVRLEDPVEFAHLLLSRQSADPEGLFNRLRAAGRERWVRLEHPFPVYVTYRTAWVDEEGTWQFRGDIYRRDAEVVAALRAAGVSVPGG